jgi:hypothetical protein
MSSSASSTNIVTHKQHGHMQLNNNPTIQMTTPMIEMRITRKEKGKPSNKPKGLQSKYLV